MAETLDNSGGLGIGEVIRYSWPASLSMLNSTLMRFVDGLMVSWLGPETSAAQLQAGLMSFVPESFATGLLAVVNTYVAQNLGANRKFRCGQYAWCGVWIALAFCIVLLPLLIWQAGPIFDLFPAEGHTPEIRPLEVMYFQYMIFATFFTLTARPLEQFFYGIGRPRIVLFASLTANTFNVLAAWGLIFGQWGLPAWGLRGAAIAAILSWMLMLGILLAFFLSPRMHKLYGTRYPLHVHWVHLKDLVRTGWPAGVQFLNDVLPWAIFTGAIVAMFGPEHFEATTFAMRWMPLSFMPAVGIGIATTALVGKYIGQGRPDLARAHAHGAMLVALVYMGTCAIAFFVLREPMIRAFITVPSTPEELAKAQQIIDLGGYVMICAAIFQLFDAAGIVFTGALRGAGDTLWPMIVTVISSWALNVGGAYTMAILWPNLGSVGPWIAATLYVVVLGIILALRFESGQWRKFDLLHQKQLSTDAQDTPDKAIRT